MIHSHCDNCIKIFKCSVRPNENSCSIIKCDGCLVLMHQCKLNDHNNICKYKKVCCINYEYGCNAIIYRKDISKHLVRCPANIVHCTVEWNRWPIDSKNLNSKYSKLLISKLENEKSNNNNICDNLDIALALRDQRMLFDLCQTEKKTRKILTNYLTQKYPAVPIKPYIGMHYSSNKQSPTQSSSSSSSYMTRFSSPAESYDCDYESPPGLQNSVCKKLIDYEDNMKSNNQSQKLDFSTAVTPIKLNSELNQNVQQQVNSLSIDINICTIAPYQKKPLFMYTFRCAQEFRRDEFEWHYKNWHNDIQGSIDGWMEHRCPLWQYGCNFVFRRWNPNPNGSKIVFNTNIESFGLKIDCDNENDLTDNNFNFETLPFEVWQNICRHLDSFSINNLSLTSKKLREVCRTILDHRGLVSLQWQRFTNDDGKYSWKVAYKKWFFSSAFSPITSWSLDINQAITHHLTYCPYYEKQVKTEPFKLLPVPKQMEETKKQI